MGRTWLKAGLYATAVILFSLVSEHHSAGQMKSGPSKCPATVRIIIKNFRYNDGVPVTIKAGDSVIWINNDDMPHTATSTDGSGQQFDTGILQPGDSSEPILFLKESGQQGFSYTCNVHDGMKGILIVASSDQSTGMVSSDGCDHHETPSVHSMVVTGSDSKSIFLHHVSLFNDTNHYYHATFEASIHEPLAQEAYQEYRQKNGDSLCILDPEHFVLTELQSKKRTSFRATFFNGKWESEIPGLKDVQVDIVRIIQFRRYDPMAVYPDRLTYQLYGNSKEVFLAHQVTAAPNFQQVIKLKDVPAFLTADLIKSNPLLVIPSKQLVESRTRTLKTAVLTNGTHILLSPPTGALNPQDPLQENEVLDVQLEGSPKIQKLTVGRLIYFDVRILNK